MIFDPIYMIIMVVAIVLSGGAAFMVKSRFAKSSKVQISSGYTGAQVAERILRDAGITDVSVEHKQAGLGYFNFAAIDYFCLAIFPFKIFLQNPSTGNGIRIRNIVHLQNDVLIRS